MELIQSTGVEVKFIYNLYIYLYPRFSETVLLNSYKLYKKLCKLYKIACPL